MLDRLQAMVREPLQRGGDIVMSSIPYTWRNQAMWRVSKAEGVIDQMTSAITTEDWSLQHCLSRLPHGTGDDDQRCEDGTEADSK
jgi:hypothetical protein